MNLKSFFFKNKTVKNAVIFMSGSGTNAERILETHSRASVKKWMPAAIVTDNPGTSRAREIAGRFGIRLIEHDILKFYRDRGETRVSIKTEQGRRIREEWTGCLRDKLGSLEIDFGILAGFVPLTNITSDFPCLNVHPGDLTVEDPSGGRLLTGLHTIPVETAILSGFTSLRSSVIIARPYTGQGGEMDSGLILGISEPVEIDFCGASLEFFKAVKASRPETRPGGGYKDKLEEVSNINLARLKESGDWVIFPQVVEDFASDNFASDEAGDMLFFRREKAFVPVKTIIYGKKMKNLYCI